LKSFFVFIIAANAFIATLPFFAGAVIGASAAFLGTETVIEVVDGSNAIDSVENTQEHLRSDYSARSPSLLWVAYIFISYTAFAILLCVY